MRQKHKMAWRKPAVHTLIAGVLRLTPMGFLALGLLLGAGCGKWKSDTAAVTSNGAGPTVSAHPFLQKWGSQPVEQARAAAVGGDASAQYHLGWIFLCGLGVSPDAVEALRWFRQAADSGVPEAQVKVGLFHELGIATIQDFTEAIRWYEKAAERGYVGAQVRLGMIYSGWANVPYVILDSPGRHYSGPAVIDDFPAAFKWYTLAAEQGFPAAQVALARILLLGWHTKPAIDASNLTNLNQLRFRQLTPPKADLAGHAKWLNIAAAQDDPEAKAAMASGQKRKNAKADTEAKRQADAEAIRQANAFIAAHPPKDWTHVTELLFHLNTSPLQPAAKASEARFKRLLARAHKGDADAQYALALCFQHDAYAWHVKYARDSKTDLSHFAPRQDSGPAIEDRFVTVRTKLAGQWYSAAAAQGHAPSMLNLAFMCANGRLGDGNRNKSLDWFTRAAKQGQAEAQFQLGRLYQEGKGVPANYAEAVKLYRAAAAQGHVGALQALGLNGTNTPAPERTVQIPSSSPTAPSRPVTRTAGKAVRLAIVPADASLRAPTDVLTALLSQQPDLQLLERSEIDRVFQELALAAASQKDFLKLGQTLGADGLLTLEPVTMDQKQRLQLTLAAVGPGVVLASERYLLPLEDLPGWSALVAKQLQFLFPKLGVTAANAVPVSFLNLRSPLATAEAVALDRELTLLLAHRLVREKELFVLERRRMDALEREKQFRGKERAAFWNGSYLLDGAVNKEGMTQGVVTISGRLVPPEGGEGTNLEVSGRRDQLAKVVDELTGKILAALRRQPQITAWNPLDEAARYFEEARWGLRWGMFQEAQAAAEAGWALGLHTRDMAVMRIESYGQQVRNERGATIFSQNKRHLSTFELKPDPAAIAPATRALELYEEHTRNMAAPEAPDEAWHGLGTGQLGWAANLLQHFYHAPATRKDLDAPLAELRARARGVAALLKDVPAARDRVGRLLVSHGAYWQDKPEEVATHYRDLAETGLYRRVSGKSSTPPMMTCWSRSDRRRASDLWLASLGSMCRSTNAAIRLEGHFWKAASADSDYELEDELEPLFKAVWESRQLIFSGKVDPAFWPAVEGFLNDKTHPHASLESGAPPVIVRLRDGVVPEFLRRMAAAKAEFDKPQQDAARLALVDAVRKALRGEGDIGMGDYFEKISKLEFTVEEARELLPLLENARKEFGHRAGILLGGPLKGRLKAKLPPQEIEAKRLALVNDLRRDMRGETALQPTEFQGNYEGLEYTDFSFTADEAQELLSLAEPFKKRLGKYGGTFSYLESILKHAAKQSTAPAVAVAPKAAVPAVAPPPPRPVSSNAAPGVLDVTRFCASPLKSTGQNFPDTQSLVTAICRQGRLWLQVESSSGRRDIWNVDLGTCASEMITLPGPDESTTAAPRNYIVNATESVVQRFEVHGGYVLARTDAGIKKFDLRRRAWRDLATKLPDQTRFFSLGDRLYATTDDSILELDPQTDAVKVLASCRQRPPRTALDLLERLNYPTVFQDPQRRPCVLLAGKVYAYFAANKDWKEVAAFATGSDWEQRVQPDGRLLLRPSSGYGKPFLSLFIFGGPATPEPVPGPAGAMPISEVKVTEDLQFLRSRDPNLFPNDISQPGRAPAAFGTPFGRGWSAALDDRDLWMLVDMMKVERRADTGRFDLKPGGRGHLLLLRYERAAGRPAALPLKLTFPPGVVDDRLLDNRGMLSPDLFRLVAVPGGLAIYWPPAAGVWYLPKEVLQPLIGALAQNVRQEQQQRLRALQEHQKHWLSLYDKNKNGVLDPEEDKAARNNSVYQKQQEELGELLRLFPQGSNGAAPNRARR